jgi:DNA-binding NarL/FixJ family response regulator
MGAVVKRVTVLVVDDHPVVHQGVRQLLERVEAVDVVHETESGLGAIAAARKLQPDIVLLDARLPDMLPAEAVRRVRLASAGSRIVMFTAHATPKMLDEIRRLGVHGVLRKDCTPEHFVDVITCVARGDAVPVRIPEDELRRAAEKLHGQPLTLREYEVLRRAAMGESNAEIGQAIFLAPTTVKSYLQSALQKLDARNRVEAVAKLSELGLL